jgi:hypothetical protein
MLRPKLGVVRRWVCSGRSESAIPSILYIYLTSATIRALSADVEAPRSQLEAATSTRMARPGRPERNRGARSFRQLWRFRHGINSVFGTHRAILRRASFQDIYKIRRVTPAALLRWVQIALKPASKTLGLHGVFIRGKGLKYVIADSAFKRMQVDARARRLDTGEHHRGLAHRTSGTLNCSE